MERILRGLGGTKALICKTWILTTVESSSFKRVSLKPRVIFFFKKKKKAIYTFSSNFLFFLCYYGRSCVHSLTDWLLLYSCQSLLRRNYRYSRSGGGNRICCLERLCSRRKSEREGSLKLLGSEEKRSRSILNFDLPLEILWLFLTKRKMAFSQ